MIATSRHAVGAMLRLDRLSKRYGEVTAVDQIDLGIQPGEFVTLLGPSGSGKTTTLMMVAGFTEPTSGEIWVDDRPVSLTPSYRRGFGMVFQNYALFPHMTIGENIAFPLKMRRISRNERDQRVNEALALVRLPGYGDRYPSQLSGGQQQRVALARSLVYRPPVLLMDEPLGALDKKLREEMQLEIKRIQSELAITTIYVTHDQEEALVMSDRIAVMNLGQVEQIASPSVLYEKPETRFVADFIGESNIIAITPSANGSGTVTFPGGQETIAPPGSSFANGQPAHLVIRPEKLRFANEAPDLPNRVSGVITEIVYVGGATKYRIAVDEHVSLGLTRQNRAGDVDYAVGDVAHVAWSPDDGCVV